MGTGFANAWTSGEIADEAWDRTDLQPVEKGCEAAINYVVRLAGPLAKRRGFWKVFTAPNPANKARMIPFRKSIDDALMLEFGDTLMKVWTSDGSTLLVSVTSPYTQAQLDGIRYKQVGDVIYLRHRDGIRGETLVRNSNTSWTFTSVGIGHEFYPNGPWLAENTDPTTTVTVTLMAGADEADANPFGGAGSMAVDLTVDLVASNPIFNPAHVGGKFRFRQTDGMPGVIGWAPGCKPAVGTYVVSNGRVYRSNHQSAFTENVTNPPINLSGSQSDGGNGWDYRHDGAGIVRIDTYLSPTHVQGTIRHTMPFRSGTATPYWSEGAWSDYRGWPRMWPALREERLVEGATAANLDFLDLTQTAGFSPLSENFGPGLGSTGVVVATDAVRRRVGTDGGELIAALEATYLLVFTTTGEHLVAGSVLDEPIDPRSVTIKDLSDYGSSDVCPVKAHKGAIFVTRGGQNLREIAIDTQQGASGDDLSVLAAHIASRGIVQLAWVPYPDNTLWLRLADGGLATMTYHKEQQVRGFTRVALPPGFVAEDIVVLPGPGRKETLWLQVSYVKAGVTSHEIWMLSQVSDQLFMDGAGLYHGAPVTTVTGLGAREGETVRILADGVQLPDQVVTGGAIVLPAPASSVQVGYPMKCSFKSLKLDTALGGALLRRQRVTGCKVSLKTASAVVALDGRPGELVSPRTAQDVPAAVSRRVIQDVTIAGDSDRDPRIAITDETAYDGLIYSLKPQVVDGD
ncbi:hypothetical protein [Phenylobacterium sp.]|uniref:hypothetical protein n=1 Tax=Phenylobacterium sp. TaxID=1871053 RepID=UPI002DE45148|nr:hypothetical protein [Phenylobacterium sp.]